MDIKQHVGDMVKDLRKGHFLSQAQLGQILGVGQKSISLIENGTNNPTLQQIEKLTDFFGVSADYLLFGKGYSPTEQERDILHVIRSDKEILIAMCNLATARREMQHLAAYKS
jgi:transcriptional regulator with XRE-family HTH domain